MDKNFKNRVYRPLKEEIDAPLDQVYRSWIRRPVTILLSIFLIIFFLLIGLKDTLVSTYKNLSEWYEDCW